MQTDWPSDLRARLQEKLDELNARLERITENVRRGLESDSEERAKQLEDSEVVDALGNDARAEIAKIKLALERMDAGEYGICAKCAGPIATERLSAHPYARACIDCAELDEQMQAKV